MRVLLCDPLNTQNNFYVYTKYLRDQGVDAHVLMGPDSLVPEGHRPNWHGDIGSGEWLHRMELPYFMPYADPVKYVSRLKRVVELARTFDVIACSGMAPLWISWTGKPFIFFSYGSDLDQIAAQGWSGNSNQVFNIRQKLSNRLVKWSMVQALHKAAATVLAPYQIDTARRLGLRNIRFMPHIIDTNLFRPVANRDQARRELRERLKCDIVLFHPPRQVWVDRGLAECKGNDKVLCAFSLFVGPYPDSKLIIVDKGWDVDRSRELASNLGISDKLVWINPINKTEMVKMYNSVDIVLDQFVRGVLTLVALEAMACNTPVVTYVAPAPAGLFYPETPPIKNTDTVSGIFNGLRDIIENKSLREQMAINGNQWVNQYCSPKNATQPYMDLFREFRR